MENGKELLKALKDQEVEIHCMVDIMNFNLFNLKYGFENGNNVLHQISEIAKKELNQKYWIYLGGSRFYFTSSWGKVESDTIYFEESILNFRDSVRNNVNPVVTIAILKNKKLPAFLLYKKLIDVVFSGSMENEGETGICYC